MAAVYGKCCLATFLRSQHALEATVNLLVETPRNAMSLSYIIRAPRLEHCVCAGLCPFSLLVAYRWKTGALHSVLYIKVCAAAFMSSSESKIVYAAATKALKE